MTTRAELREVAEAFAAGSGPVAVDAERASGFRYSQRAYLVQLRREGAGTALVDPIPLRPDSDPSALEPLARALEGPEWVLHAASQDLACLDEIGLRPTSLFDTELAGRLAGLPRVGLGPMVETPGHQTDLEAVVDGYVAVSPLHLDLTHDPSLDALNKRFAAVR